MKTSLKIAVVLAIVGLLSVVFAYTAFAYTPPDQSTDNATDIILWHGDTANVTANLTGSATITITDLEDALTAASEAGADVIADEMGVIFVTLIMFLFLFGLAFLAHIRGDRPMYLIAGLGFIVYGFTFISTELYACILMVLAGAVMVSRAFGKRREQ